ncbi:hypothetical protein ACLOJK_034957 [Asimina triloba]
MSPSPWHRGCFATSIHKATSVVATPSASRPTHKAASFAAAPSKACPSTSKKVRGLGLVSKRTTRLDCEDAQPLRSSPWYRLPSFKSQWVKKVLPRPLKKKLR